MSLDREHRDTDRDAPIPAMHADAITASEWGYSVVQWLRKVTPTDVLDEMCEHEDELQALMVAGDEAGIGRLFLKTRLGYAQRLAQGDVL